MDASAEAENVDVQACAWVEQKFPFSDEFRARDMVTAYRSGFAAGLAHARAVFMAPPSAGVECPYCGATSGLRYKHRGYGPVAPEVTCEGCFTPRDDGPCFDDLPEVP